MVIFEFLHDKITGAVNAKELKEEKPDGYSREQKAFLIATTIAICILVLRLLP